MAMNVRAPITEDIWHLSIDDLLSPLPEKPRLGGLGPFVINLSSSSACIGLPTLHLTGCETAHAYEIQRNEDGRTRYRLRLGPFDTENAADLILQMVREIYPSALTATAGPDDLKSIASIRTKAAAAAEARRPAQPPQRPEPPVVTTRAEPLAIKPVAAPPPALLNEAVSFSVDISFADIIPPTAPQLPAITDPLPPLLTERASTTVPPAAQPVALPAVVGTPHAIIATPPATAPVIAPAPVKKPASLWASLPVAPRMTAHNPRPASGNPSMSVSAPLVRRPVPPVDGKSAPPAAPNPPKPSAALHDTRPGAHTKRGDSPVSLESTHTVRALTPAELADGNALPWFVIELATAGEAFDPDTVPNLDIFAEYRLYCVAEMGTADIVHALRVGFFSAEIAAKAVASYLAAYYDKPAIKRVSLAERERFAQQAVEARKDVGATGRHAVIEITDDLVARKKRSTGQSACP